MAMVTVMGCADCPMLVVPKSTWVGDGDAPGASAPVPARATVVEDAVEADVALSEPVTAPTDSGENRTPAVQLAPADNALPQVVVFGSRAKPAVTPTVRSVIGEPPELVTLTNWAGLLWPVRIAPKES